MLQEAIRNNNRKNNTVYLKINITMAEMHIKLQKIFFEN